MKRYLGYGAIVLVGYVVFMLILFPADRAYRLLQTQLPGVELFQVQGTLWSGTAQAVVVRGKTLRNFSWELKPLGLFKGRIEADVKFDSNTTWASANVGVGLGEKIVVSSLQGQLPVVELQALLPPAPAKLAGMLQLNFDKLVYASESKQLEYAQGRVEWQGASVTVMQEAAIGDYQLDLTTTDQGVEGTFSDINEGPMQVQGGLTLGLDKQYKVDAKLKVRDASRQDLVQSVRFIGKADNDGNVVFSKAGTL